MRVSPGAVTGECTGGASFLYPKFVLKSQTMVAELELKSPFLSPFFKGGNFFRTLSPLFGKEGKGRFFR